MHQKIFIIKLLVLITSCPLNAESSSEYHEITLEGWPIFIEQSLVNKSDPRVFKALRKLKSKLVDTKNAIPNHHIEKLQNVPLWISRNNGNNVEFYFYKTRVIRLGITPKKFGGIEFKNISIFLEMIETYPALVIHELAHAFHKNNYKTIDKLIMRAYKNSQTKHLYKNVSNRRNHSGSAVYASRNSYEYFADLTSMYFGENDYYPHNRDELYAHDPMGYKMIEEVWQ